MQVAHSKNDDGYSTGQPRGCNETKETRTRAAQPLGLQGRRPGHRPRRQGARGRAGAAAAGPRGPGATSRGAAHQRGEMRQSPADPVILSRASWQAPAPPLVSINETELTLNVGQEISPEELVAWLVERSFEEHPQIFQRGQFARRGGILDFFPAQLSHPIRIEFFGDEIESIREFSVETQTTTRKLELVEIRKESETFDDLPESKMLLPTVLVDSNIMTTTTRQINLHLTKKTLTHICQATSS